VSEVRSVPIAMAIAALAAIAFAACGGGDSTSSTATATGASVASITAAPSGAGTKTAAPAGATTAAATATQANGGGDASDPCSFLTQAEVEAALGETVDAPKATAGGTLPVSGSVTANVSNCDYSSPTTVHSVSVDVWSAPGSSDAIKQLTQLVCSTKEAVSGLGDVACWYSSDHTELQFSKGATFLDLHGSTSGDPGQLLTTLAQKAVDRLP
jgi:hypothetical protein